MKVIDLLNKIANGEELPQKIAYDKKVYKVSKNFFTDVENETFFKGFSIEQLNDEVEIIEEPKKTVFRFDKDGISMYAVYGDEEIEEDKEIEEINIEWFKQVDMFDAKSVELAIEAIAKQLNETIKVVNELKKGK